MTAVPPPVPPEIERRAAEALGRHHWDGTGCGTNGTSGCLYCFGPSPADSREVALIAIAAVYGDIVEAARRDALQSLWDDVHADLDRHATTYGAEDQRFRDGMAHAAAKVLLLRDATAPRTAPAATQANQQPESAPGAGSAS